MRKLTTLLLLTFFMSSCATSQQFRDNAVAIGAGIGVATGAIVGQITGRDTTGTAVGAAVGGALGAMIGFVYNSQTNKVADAKQTQASMPVTRQEEPVLSVREQYIEPGDKIQMGGEVTVRLIYVVFNHRNPRQPVMEKRSLWHNDKCVQVLDEKEEIRENGTYETLVYFKVPEKFEKGKYKINHEIQTDDGVIYSTIDFTVI